MIKASPSLLPPIKDAEWEKVKICLTSLLDVIQNVGSSGKQFY